MESSDLDNLKSKINNLERNAEEERSKLWFKKPSNIIAVVAVVITAISAAYTFLTENNRGQKEITKEIISTAEKIIELRSLGAIADKENSTLVEKVQLASIGTKTKIYLEKIEMLILEDHTRVPSSAYRAVSQQYSSFEDYSNAMRYGKLALNSSITSKEKIENNWNIAVIFYSKQTPELISGRKYFKKAIDILNDKSNPYLNAKLISVLISWSRIEAKTGSKEVAIEKLMKAQEILTSIPRTSKLFKKRSVEFMYLEKALNSNKAN